MPARKESKGGTSAEKMWKYIKFASKLFDHVRFDHGCPPVRTGCNKCPDIFLFQHSVDFWCLSGQQIRCIAILRTNQKLEEFSWIYGRLPSFHRSHWFHLRSIRMILLDLLARSMALTLLYAEWRSLRRTSRVLSSVKNLHRLENHNPRYRRHPESNEREIYQVLALNVLFLEVVQIVSPFAHLWVVLYCDFWSL